MEMQLVIYQKLVTKTKNNGLVFFREFLELLLTLRTKMKLITKASVIAVVFLGMTGISSAQDAKVVKISSTTDDGIEFQVSVKKSDITHGEDLRINYAVKNNNKKSVYLIIETLPIVRINSSGNLEIFEPVRMPDDHDPYNYEFVKIAPTKTHKGNFLVKSEIYVTNKKFAFDVNIEIQVGFSYLFDISSQKGCKEKDYQYHCLYDLYNESKSLKMGNLVIDINDK